MQNNQNEEDPGMAINYFNNPYSFCVYFSGD